VEVTNVSARVGGAKDVKEGHMRVFDVAGTDVNVANANGHLYAFDDSCTHMGCSLADGRLTGTVVTCACHGSQFDVTSGASSADRRSGQSVPGPCRSRATISLSTREPPLES
jgi:nitrite reductase/ring-hydroxylating ferredoxin subunit